MFLFKKNTAWMTIIEIIGVIMVVSIGLMSAWYTIAKWQENAYKTELRITAINIAREWAEVMQNIRNTNWIKLSSDRKNCWNVYNYNTDCIGDPLYINAIGTGCYILANTWGEWRLSTIITTYPPPAPNIATFRNNFPVYFDANGLITQTGSSLTSITRLCAGKTSNNCKSIFWRAVCVTSVTNNRMKIKSIVKWVWWSVNTIQDITFDLTLTNWKANF